MDLPPLSLPGGCPKCGKPSVSMTYHSAGCMMTPGPPRGEEWPCMHFSYDHLGEHMCRVCERCGHGWLEATADSEAAES